jgi:hypothetical protein
MLNSRLGDMLLKLKIYLILPFVLIFLMPGSKAQCTIYVEMVHAVECTLPRVVKTQELLLPCSAPAELYALPAGEHAFIDFKDTTCFSFCQQGRPVAITCFTLAVSTDNPVTDDFIQVYPTFVQSIVHVRGKNIQHAALFNTYGILLKQSQAYPVDGFNTSDLEQGIYFIQVFTPSGVAVRKIIKL